MTRETFDPTPGNRRLPLGTVECIVHPQGLWIAIELEEESVSMSVTEARVLRDWLNAVIPKENPP